MLVAKLPPIKVLTTPRALHHLNACPKTQHKHVSSRDPDHTLWAPNSMVRLSDLIANTLRTVANMLRSLEERWANATPTSRPPELNENPSLRIRERNKRTVRHYSIVQCDKQLERWCQNQIREVNNNHNKKPRSRPRPRRQPRPHRQPEPQPQPQPTTSAASMTKGSELLVFVQPFLQCIHGIGSCRTIVLGALQLAKFAMEHLHEFHPWRPVRLERPERLGMKKKRPIALQCSARADSKVRLPHCNWEMCELRRVSFETFYWPLRTQLYCEFWACAFNDAFLSRYPM